MSQPEPASVVIACPHCGTRYQVPYATIGAKGRPVQCAHCGKSWDAQAEPPETAPAKLVDAQEETRLDEEFAAEARRSRSADSGEVSPERSGDHQRMLDEIKAAIAPKPRAVAEIADPAAQRRQQQEFSRRQRRLNSRLPVARLRRSARLAVLGALVVVLVAGLVLRSPIVQTFPQLAAAYAAVGLGVNVVGLEFRDVHTLKSLQQGAEVLVVEGRIASVANSQVPVPQVLVTLLGPRGTPVYEWSMLPRAAELKPGETVRFETQLSKPPPGAATVKLRFGEGRPPPVVADGSDAQFTPPTKTPPTP